MGLELPNTLSGHDEISLVSPHNVIQGSVR